MAFLEKSLRLSGEVMIPYTARLLDITMNNNAIPGDWKKAVVIPIYKGRDRSVVGNYRPDSLTSVVCKQLEHIIAGCLRQVWEISGWLYVGQHGFRPRYSCQKQVVTFCQDIADSVDEGVRTDEIIIDFSKTFDLVPHERLLTKIAATEVDLRVVVWVKESLLGRPQRVTVDGQLSEEVRVTSGVPQGSALGPLLFLVHVTDIWRNVESNIWLIAVDCVIYRKIMVSSDDKLQMDQNRLREWAVENEMKINPCKSKAVNLTKDGVKERIMYYFGDQLTFKTRAYYI